MNYSNIEKYFSEERLAELRQFTEEFRADPRNWSNNKRRRRGLKPLRKGNSFSKRKWSKVQYEIKFFKLIEKTIDEALCNYIPDRFNKLVDIKDIPF